MGSKVGVFSFGVFTHMGYGMKGGHESRSFYRTICEAAKSEVANFRTFRRTFRQFFH